MLQTNKNKLINRLSVVTLILLMLFYLIFLIFRFLNFDFNSQLGYLDLQLYWQGLADLSAGKVIYRDFYWEYGFLYLLIGMPFFILLNKTFFASIFIRVIILPSISIFLSFLLGKELLNKKSLILFLFLLLLYGVNNDFVSLRHLLPEFGLLTVILGTEFNNRKKIKTGSIILGLSLVSSIEYGIVATISALIYFFVSWIKKQDLNFLYSSMRNLLTVEGIVAAPYFLYLWKNQALNKMVTFFKEYAGSFYYNSPCRDLFPRINEISQGIDFFQRLNLYFIPFLLLFLAIWAITKIKKSTNFPIISTLIIYSLLIYYRTLNTPCLNYMNYGLVFTFLILIFLISQPSISLNLKRALGVILTWFVILGLFESIPQFTKELSALRFTNTLNEKFLPVAGARLKKELANEYKETIDFIQENSEDGDFIYVYPNGPYYQLAQRNPAVSIASSWYYDLVPSLVNTTLNQLTQRKPELVIINTHNASSLKTNLNNLNYNIHSEGKDLIFEGITTPVEDFISGNYEIVKKTQVAWILTRRKEPMSVKRLYLPIDLETRWEIKTQGLTRRSYLPFDDSIVFRVEKQNPLINLTAETFRDIDQVLIPIKVNLGFSKTFSKYIINVYAVVGNDRLYLLNRQLAAGDWQDLWINLPHLDEATQITGILTDISDNRGFFWFGQPKEILLKPPKAFVRNQNLKIEDSALKKN